MKDTRNPAFDQSYVGDLGAGFVGALIPTDKAQALVPATGALVVGTAGPDYTATERDLLNAVAALVNNQKRRLDDLEAKLKAIDILN